MSLSLSWCVEVLGILVYFQIDYNLFLPLLSDLQTALEQVWYEWISAKGLQMDFKFSIKFRIAGFSKKLLFSTYSSHGSCQRLLYQLNFIKTFQSTCHICILIYTLNDLLHICEITWNISSLIDHLVWNKANIIGEQF